MLQSPRKTRVGRTTAKVLCVMQVLVGVPLAAQRPAPATTTTSAAVPAKPLPAPKVNVNRKVPAVTPVPVEPKFSTRPTAAEIFRARIFDEPVVPVGGVPTDVENAVLAKALLVFHRSGASDASALDAFLATSASSPWRASLLLNLGTFEVARRAHGTAIERFRAAWTIASAATDRYARPVADSALAEWMTVAASFGQVEVVETLLRNLQGRVVSGSAGVKISRAREVISLIKRRPDLAALCGPEALMAFIEAKNGEGAARPKALTEYKGTLAGTTLLELQQLAKDAGLSMRMVRRLPTAEGEIPVPSVAHLKLKHYVTITEHRDDRYFIVDRAQKQSYWVSREVLLSEVSGYFLVQDGPLLNGWVDVDLDEAAKIVGSGPVCEDGAAPPGPPPPPPCPPPGGGGGGMCNYQLQDVTASLLIYDTPAGYAPARGPNVWFTLSYHQREAFQPQVFSSSHLGPKWTLEWLRFVQEEPTFFDRPAHAWVALPPGGREVFTNPDGGGVFAQHWNSRATLVRVSLSPARYERRLPDGSVEVFAHADGAPVGSRKIFLTELIDPRGQTLAFTWDAQLRLVAITDSIGQVSTIQYGDTSDPLRITGFSDPFSRHAILAYNSAGQLESITDVLGLQSRLSYGQGDFVTTLTTPYGTTSFRHEPEALNTLYTMRFIEATDPTGATEHLEFQWETPSLPGSEPSNLVPSGFSAWNTRLNLRNTFYWDKQAWAAGPGDLSKATITHWLEMAEWDGWQIYSQPIPHSIKRPLERRVWYSYPGQPIGLEWYAGTWRQPARIGRVLDDGLSQIHGRTYNQQGKILAETDPLGRQTTYTYDVTGIDLLSVRQTSPGIDDLLSSYGSYTPLHQPQSVTDAAGQVTSYTYNAAGQLLTVTNALQETTTYGYDGSGRLISVTGAGSGDVTTLGYDSYGRLRTLTEPDGYVVTIDYDSFDRVVRRSYPDGTYEETAYERLSKAAYRDRLGRITRYYHDNAQRLVATRDPLGRTESQVWCDCGSLLELVDGKGNRTRWLRDVQGRVVQELRANGTTGRSYTYDVSGRTRSVTDAKGQVATYDYALDDEVVSVSFSNSQGPTANVSYSHSSTYRRLIAMQDGTGTTTYSYKAPGANGAGNLSSVDGPLSNDTISYNYDSLNRQAERVLGSNVHTVAYDSSGRVTVETNILGSFEYEYDGASTRLSSVQYPNGQTTVYSYLGGSADRRLQSITNKYPSGAVLSKFDYTYDSMGNIRTWRQQADTDAVLWRFAYDGADQLVLATKESVANPPSILAFYRYGYDTAGNRTFEQVDETVTTTSYDSLNRLTTRVAGGALAVTGSVSEPAAVRIAGLPADVDGQGYFSGAVAAASGANQFSVVATDASGNAASRSFEVTLPTQARTFTHDLNGNLTDDGLRTFEWDARNRLLAVATGTKRTEFTYDGNGRAVGIVEKLSGNTVRNTRHVWCQDSVCEERDAAGAVVSTFHPLGYELQGEAVFITRNHIGSVHELTDDSGLVQSRFAYDPYGRQTVVAGTADNISGFTGHRPVADQGLLQTRYRFFDPELGRWLSEDPSAFADGPNLYAYVRNDPIDRLDPLGLQGCEGPCCPNQMVLLWICTRPIDAWYGIFLSHSYVCCAGANKGCFGHQSNDLKVGDAIPPEGNPTGQCNPKRVCPQEFRAKCSNPRSPCNAGTLGWNCHSWANWNGGPTSCAR